MKRMVMIPVVLLLVPMASWERPLSSHEPESYADAVLADSPSHFYRLGEGSGSLAADLSGFDRHGEYPGAASLGQSGGLANDSDTAVRFGGTMVGLPGSEQGLATGNAPRTVEAWFKTTKGPTLVARWGSIPGAFEVAVSGSQVTVRTSSGSNIIGIETGRKLDDGRWHHLVLTYDGTTYLVYVDGQLRAERTWVTLNTVATVPSFGSSGALGEHIYLDEVALYPVVLSQEQVEAHFEASGNERPVAPETVTASSTVDNQVSVSWSPVSVSVPQGQAAVDHYVVTAKRDGVPRGAVGVAGSQTSVVVRGVPAGDYQIEVYAVNGFGRGPAGVSSTVVVAGAGVTYSSIVLADSPSHFYRLGEGSGSLAADLSGFDRHGEYPGAASLGQSGGLANDSDTAVRFGGTMVGLPGSEQGLATGNAPRTVEAWFKTTSARPALVARWGSNPGSFEVAVSGSQVTVRTSSGSNIIGIDTGVALSDGNWHHLVLTYDGTTYLVYVDGQLRAERTWVTLNTVATVPRFGSSDALGAHIYLDEVALYPRVLTHHQVLEHWHYSSAEPRPGRSKGALS